MNTTSVPGKNEGWEYFILLFDFALTELKAGGKASVDAVLTNKQDVRS